MTISLLLATLSGSGCQSSHTVEVGADGAPRYEQVKVVYEVSQSPLDVDSEPSVKLDYIKTHPLKAAIAGRQDSKKIAALARPVSRLTIEYPHPNGNAELAQAILEVPGDGELYQEIAVTGLRRQELDLLLVNLANGGAFDSEQRPAGDTQVAIEIDGHGIARRWTSEPRLDRLAAETYDAR